MQPFKSTLQVGAITLAVSVFAGCSATGTQATHHWVSQDKVAGNVYRNDVASCSASNAQRDASSTEFKAYQQCMNERGYALVAANEIGEAGRE